jgi:phosphoenolpyruvate carboxylase
VNQCSAQSDIESVDEFVSESVIVQRSQTESVDEFVSVLVSVQRSQIYGQFLVQFDMLQNATHMASALRELWHFCEVPRDHRTDFKSVRGHERWDGRCCIVTVY